MEQAVFHQYGNRTVLDMVFLLKLSVPNLWITEAGTKSACGICFDILFHFIFFFFAAALWESISALLNLIRPKPNVKYFGQILQN